METIQFYNSSGGGYNLSKILQKESFDYEGQIPLGLFYNQMLTVSSLGFEDIMKASVIDDSFFTSPSLNTTRRNKLKLKTTKKHK